MPRKPKLLTREGEPSQKTDKHLEIPIPKTEDFDRVLKRAAEYMCQFDSSIDGERDR